MTTPTGVLFQNPIVKPLSSNGTFLANCTATFFLTGTTTPATVYADGTLTTPLANPVTADASGTFVAVYLDPAVVYRVQIKTSTGTLISDTDPVVPAPGLTQSGIGFVFYPRTPIEISAGITPVNYFYPQGNVLRYGNNSAPGVTDMTAAFNAATFSAFPYSLFPLLNDVIVPPGEYAINGTVYVRKGQRLRGSEGATYIVANNTGLGPTFQMGWGNVASTPAADAGGQPVSIEGLFIVGGPASGCIVFNGVAGGFVHDVFISSPAVGIQATNSTDLNFTDIIIDQGLTGISLSGCGNIQGTTIKFFNTNFDLTIGSNTYDCQFTNCHSEFNQFTSVLFADAATNIVNCRFTDWTFTYNVQYGTFTGTIQNRASGTVAVFNGCSFNNVPLYAYTHGTGTGSDITFNHCTFDGQASATAYSANQTLTMGAINTLNETVRCKGCIFKNMPGPFGTGGLTPKPPILLAGTLASVLELDGCEYFNITAGQLVHITNSAASGSAFRAVNVQGDLLTVICDNQATVPITIRNCRDWFGAIGASGSSHFVTVPYQFSNVYQITLRANINAGGNVNYRKCTMTFAEKDNDFSGSAKSFIATATPIQGAANTNGVIATVVEFGTVGGGTNIAQANSGSLAISWPNSYSSESIDVQMMI